MLPQNRLAKIRQMEHILNQAHDLIDKMEQLQSEWQRLLPQIRELENYYGEQWQADYNAYDQGEIPSDMPCGVLSEDLVFNASTGHHGLAIEYLKVVAKVLDQAKD